MNINFKGLDTTKNINNREYNFNFLATAYKFFWIEYFNKKIKTLAFCKGYLLTGLLYKGVTLTPNLWWGLLFRVLPSHSVFFNKGAARKATPYPQSMQEAGWKTISRNNIIPIIFPFVNNKLCLYTKLE